MNGREPKPFLIRRRPRSVRCRSSALVIVLACLVLITILVVAFMGAVSTERQSAQFYANSSSVKLLAESAVSVAMGQIKDATKGTDATGGNLAWASQPGMIRTYDTNAQPQGYYKLYSWDSMVGTGAYDPTATTAKVPGAWMQSPALYTDLNDPVSGVYPIVDPAATTLVKGFTINSAPTSTTDAAPMPVQWLYVLQDGSLATATGGVGNTVTVTGAGTGNPIVARIAFWTDDDTSKVNINTAAGDVWTDASSAPAPGVAGNPGSFWDIPRTANLSFEKLYLAKYQPAKNEYQRYPGHPATTYLSAVFPSLTAANIDAIIPRVASGGSTSGTTVAAAAITPDSDRLYASVDELMFTPNISSALRTTNAPLGQTQIEQAKFFLTAHSRAPEVNLYNQPRVSIWPVSSQNDVTHRTPYDQLIAYCGTLDHGTASAAATTPYLYYFQRGAYDLNAANGCNSPTADLPAIASTTVPATDLTRNRQLITYLRNLTAQPVPGFSTSGQTFLSKYPKDRDEILTEIFDYIRGINAQDKSVTGLQTYALTSAGLGGTLGQGQIIPITDTVHSDSNSAALRGFGRFPTVREAGLVFVGVGQTTGSGASTKTSVPPLASQLPGPGNPIASGNTRVQAFFYLNFFDPNQGYALAWPNFYVRISGLNSSASFKWGPATASISSMGFTDPVSAQIRAQSDTGDYGGYKGASPCVGSFCANSGGLCSILSTVIDLPTNSTASPTAFVFQGGDVTVQIYDSTNTNLLQTLTINIPSGNFPVPYLAPQLQFSTVGPPAQPYLVDYRKLSAWTQGMGSMGSAGALPPNTLGRFTIANDVNASGFPIGAKMWICGTDVIRSVEANTDIRLIAAMKDVPKTYFSEMEPQYASQTTAQVHSLAETGNGAGMYTYIGCSPGKFVADADYGTGTGAPTVFTANCDFNYSGFTGDNLQPIATPQTAPGGTYMPIAFGLSGGYCTPVDGVYAGVNKTGSGLQNPPGDYDTGMSIVNDGAFVNKVDEGSITGVSSASLAYYEQLISFTSVGGTFFSPNRQISSPVAFGSLPTGVGSNQPWQTLLFQPDPGGTPQHTGAQSPQDHLFLDLFTMPVVEPYAISDPFSTAGKVNMNYQIVPFTYLSRTTALRAVMKGEQMLALANTDAKLYKVQNGSMPNRRTFLDLDETLSEFQSRFNAGDIFRSASEICNILLVPQGQTYSGMTGSPTFWSTHLLTGDNVREKPYGDLYPRLTTKSNTFTVHYRVQTLKKVATTSTSQWVESTDIVTAEYRGSSTLERYLDTSDPNIPDYATLTQPLAAGKAIDNFYKFRVIETKQFTP